MTALVSLMGGLGVLISVLGCVRLGAARARAPRDAIATASGTVGSGASAGRTPPVRTARPVAPRLPAVLGYVERRARTAGVEWPLGSVLLVMAASGCGAALVMAVATGVLWLTLLASCAGLYAPIWRLNRVAWRRAQVVRRQLDQVCTELIQALAGGLDLPAALIGVAQRAPDPVGRELQRVWDRVREGEALGEAAREIPERLGLDEARLLACGIRLATEAGTRIIPVLESIQRSLRGRREIHGLIRELGARDEKQAMMLFVIPLVLLLAVRLEAPAYAAPLLHTPAGQWLLLADFGWMLCGLQIVRNFFAGTPLS